MPIYNNLPERMAKADAEIALDKFINAYATMEISGVDDSENSAGLAKALASQPADKLAEILMVAIRRLAAAPREVA